MKVKSFTDLYAWQKAHVLSLHIYKATRAFPTDEYNGLTNQLRRASVSITSNLAEGFGRRTTPDKSYRYSLAVSSLYEVQSQLLIARDIGFIPSATFITLAELSKEVSRLTNRLISSLDSKK